MSPTSELHPEEMLDAARRGTLSPAARADLDAHLRRCPACRMQISMTTDFASAEAAAPPPGRADAEMLAGMIRRVAARPGMQPARSTVRGRLGRRLAFAALYLAIGSGAASAMWSWHARTTRPAPAAPETEGGKPSARPSIKKPAAPEPTPPPLVPAEAPAAAETRAPARAVARHASPAPEIQRPAPETPPPVEAIDRSASAIFAQANHARRAGHQAAALAQYRDLQSRFPGSRETLTSRVIVGQLGLDRGDPAAALLSFRGYLSAAPTGTLAEEARWGCAQALLQLQHTDQEAVALQELLTRHPTSVHAPRARARLAELRGRPSSP
jgi:TolA-binding protein